MYQAKMIVPSKRVLKLGKESARVAVILWLAETHGPSLTLCVFFVKALTDFRGRRAVACALSAVELRLKQWHWIVM